MYSRLFKRLVDLILSFTAILLLLPILLFLTISGSIAMKGNPFFVQVRPGKNEKCFKLIKFRTMSEAKDSNGIILPDSMRLNKYGQILRKTSLDELPELFNIFIGDMSIIGPRPLVPEYLPYYTEDEHHRHDVRPGLSGLAQINGRSFITWEEIFAYDLEYIRNITFIGDVKIVFKTIVKALLKKDVADTKEGVIGEDGKMHFLVNDKEYILHQPLNIERALK